ncbi:hypothetical protein [Chryseobacterium pennipullorum]|uniref:Uncharacterized protein n=1 Tax=Chryseobacterium pennipullorum TaxID=2258963 RepID=A0A3D9BAD9_9FLAO|nr:hypothetical protein [Chryseobacterium pennipullorum]REC50132.1 hypothetical protein DRF67_00915 [Chryseobacterium pennipullorum]
MKNFSVNSTGWNGIIRQLLFEFAVSGWDINHDVFGKEKSGELRCSTYSENPELNAVIKNITTKYLNLSVKTCEICGSEGKPRVVQSWQTTLCLTHYLEQHPAIEIDGGLNVSIKNKKLLNLREIVQADIEYDLQKIWLYTEMPADDAHAFCFSWQEPNYYLLLKTIPGDLFPEDRQEEISKLFQNLKNCEICGYTAVHQKSCLRCHHEEWNDSGFLADDYRERSEYIKACQMDIFLDEDNYEKYFKRDRSFEKYPDHQILFCHKDLRAYQ